MSTIAPFNPEQISIVVFDVDDTLTRNTMGIKIDIFAQLFADKYDRLQAARELYEFTGKGDRYNIIAHVIDVPQSEAHTHPEVRALAATFEEQTRAAIRAQGLHEHDIAALVAIRDRYQCYILSATPTTSVAGNISYFEERYPEIAGMFNAVIGTPMHAGKGGELLAIAKKHNIDTASILMVGDGGSDYNGALYSGSQFVAIIPEGKPDKWSDADFPKAATVADLPELLKKP